jgi:carbohydrate esterase-like protein/GDSL-like lipase/acylhydrolase family protein
MPEKYFIALIFALIIIKPGCDAQSARIPFNDAHIRYMGRVAMKDSAAQLAWPGTSVKMNFSGTGVSVLLRDEHGDNYYNVILDGRVASILHPDSIKKVYTLAAGLPAARHSLELFKRTEWDKGKTWLFQFLLDKNTIALEAPPLQKRRMEFFGNSITCGYAVEDSTGQDRGTAPYENGYISYAAITARHFDAAFHSTSKSGIGILVSWFPLIMPEMFDRLDATDPKSKWDFSKYTPDIVVINLLQNDSWLFELPDNPQFKARFGTTAPTPDSIVRAYRNFVKNIRQKYPKAWIICALGNMDATRQGSPWPGYIEKAVAALKDNRIYTYFFPYNNTHRHPSPAEQRAMADDLIGFIEKNIKW